jgi:hypothetical protein
VNVRKDGAVDNKSRPERRRALDFVVQMIANRCGSAENVGNEPIATDAAQSMDVRYHERARNLRQLVWF